jgi:hypothetical protein
MSFNHNWYCSGDHFTNALKCFYLGPENSTTLSQSNKHGHARKARNAVDVTFEWLIDGDNAIGHRKVATRDACEGTALPFAYENEQESTPCLIFSDACLQRGAWGVGKIEPSY